MIGKSSSNQVITKVYYRDFFYEIMDKGTNPAEEIRKLFHKVKEGGDDELAFRILNCMLSYMYPKLKSIEFKTSKAIDDLTKEQKIEALKEMLKSLESGPNDGNHPERID